MLRNVAFITLGLFLVAFVTFFVLNYKLGSYLNSSLSQLPQQLKTKNIDLFDYSFEEVGIDSFKSVSIRNLKFSFDYPENPLKSKLFLKVENASLLSKDFSYKHLILKLSGISLNYKFGNLITQTKWLTENYPQVGLESGNFEALLNGSESDRKTEMASFLLDIFEFLKNGKTKKEIKFNAKLKFFKGNEAIYLNVREQKNEQGDYYLALKDDQDPKYETDLVKAADIEIDKQFFIATYLIDLSFYLENLFKEVMQENANFPIVPYQQVLNGYFIKQNFKEDFYTKLLEKLPDNVDNAPEKNMYITNLKQGSSYSDKGIKEVDIKKLILEDKQVALRPSNISVKIKQ